MKVYMNSLGWIGIEKMMVVVLKSLKGQSDAFGI